jgi:hypothetical protein
MAGTSPAMTMRMLNAGGEDVGEVALGDGIVLQQVAHMSEAT